MPDGAEEAGQAPATPDSAGWYRNHAPFPVTVMFPASAVLAPGEARWLAADPQYPDIKPCDAPDTAAAEVKE